MEIGKYQIICSLGEGQFGQVFKAFDRAIEQEKAIKVINIDSDEQITSVLNEARLLNKCKHKHIVKINEADVYESEGRKVVIIDMEFIGGGSLECQLANTFVSIKEVRKIFIDILFGLEFAHSKSILHRDVKPANIMIDKNYAKLSDFGLATILATKTLNSIVGYTTHLAPEIIVNGTTTLQSDIYAVGVSLFRALNNIANWRERINQIGDIGERLKSGTLLETLGYESYIPKKMKAIIRKATNLEVNKRFLSASQFRNALESLKPDIEWHRITIDKWTGELPEKGLITAEVIQTGCQYTVQIKKNNRRILALCQSFDDLGKAIAYLQNYVAETTFN
ncbi:MAG: serine/threonine protein kinase [Bacteroidetes bacterium]|nr:serine/threonine protein kinase [Bacteroidota bacterium]